MSEVVLVCAAHPDDEVLGCGATMAAHAARGDAVHVLILGEGVTSRRASRSVEDDRVQLDELSGAAQRANDILGAASLEIQQLPDNRMDSVDRLDVVKLVEGVIARVRPRIVYTHHAGDLNSDHQVIHDAVCVAARPYPAQTIRELMFFEVLSSTEWRPAASSVPFVPNCYVDVAETLNRKLEALAQYQGEMREWPHARSLRAVEHLARLRGASVGLEAAEAFALGRRIVTI